jgi:hypothetical protein
MTNRYFPMTVSPKVKLSSALLLTEVLKVSTKTFGMWKTGGSRGQTAYPLVFKDSSNEVKIPKRIRSKNP